MAATGRAGWRRGWGEEGARDSRDGSHPASLAISKREGRAHPPGELAMAMAVPVPV